MTVLTILYAIEKAPEMGGVYVHAQIGNTDHQKPAVAFDTGGPTEKVVESCMRLWHGVTTANEALGVFESIRGAVVIAAKLEENPEAVLLARTLGEALCAHEAVEGHNEDHPITVN